jgi:K+-sensing histidine kinase KdpD
LNVKQVVEKVLTVFNGEEGAADMNFILDPSLDIEIQSDHYMLEVALRNVIENAIVYRAEKNPEVKISISSNGTYHGLSISDNGRGISDEASVHIFDMFYRGSEQSSGAGLGLYITREALKKINGEIGLTRGENTTFFINIPVVHQPEVVCKY